MSDAAITPLRRSPNARQASSFGLRETAITLVWLITSLIALVIMGGLIVDAVVGRIIAAAIVLAVAVVFHVTLRPSAPPPPPKRAPQKDSPSDVIDRVHRQILGSGAAGAAAIRR